MFTVSGFTKYGVYAVLEIRTAYGADSAVRKAEAAGLVEILHVEEDF